MLLVASCLALVVSFPSHAAIPEQINIQGVLQPRPAEQTSIYIMIWDKPTDGTQQWSFNSTVVYSNPQTGNVMINDNGFFSLSLPVPVNITFDEPYYVEFNVDGKILAPRQPLLSAPYAFTAKNVYGGSGYFAGSVGIGTTAPTSPLDISDLGVNSGFKIQTTNLGPNLVYQAYQGGTKDLHIAFEDLSHNITEVMTIKGNTSTGNVGIGTTDPTAKLNVIAGAATAGSFESASGVGVYGKSNNKFGIEGYSQTRSGVYGHTDGAVAAGVSGIGGYGVWGNGSTAGGSFESTSGFGVYSHALKNYFSGNIGIGAVNSGTAKLAVMGGFVGIGTTSPGENLVVAGPAPRIVVQSNDIGNDTRFEENTNGGALVLTNDQGEQNVVLRGYGDSTFNAPTGNVGIGTANPTAKLHVNGSINVQRETDSITAPADLSSTTISQTAVGGKVSFSAKTASRGSGVYSYTGTVNVTNPYAKADSIIIVADYPAPTYLKSIVSQSGNIKMVFDYGQLINGIVDVVCSATYVILN